MVCIGCFIPWGLSERGTPIGQAGRPSSPSIIPWPSVLMVGNASTSLHRSTFSSTCGPVGPKMGQRWGWCLARDGKVLDRCGDANKDWDKQHQSNEKQVGKRVSTASFRWHPDKQVSVIVILKYWLTATWAQASNLDHCIRSGEMQPERCSAWTAECSLTGYLICSNVNPALIDHWTVESGYIPLT